MCHIHKFCILWKGLEYENGSHKHKMQSNTFGSVESDITRKWMFCRHTFLVATILMWRMIWILVGNVAHHMVLTLMRSTNKRDLTDHFKKSKSPNGFIFKNNTSDFLARKLLGNLPAHWLLLSICNRPGGTCKVEFIFQPDRWTNVHAITRR